LAAYHPLDDAFKALADPNRRLLLDRLNERNGQTLRELCAGLDMARQSVSKHLAVLEAANLVTTVRRGREKLHYLNAAPINEITERWITRYERDRVHALADLKQALEDNVDKPSFVYVNYIKTTPERLWQALTEPAFTERYWGMAFHTDWKTGSRYVLHQFGLSIVDDDQMVLEADPYRRLSYTWHAITPEWADALDLTDDARERLAAEPRSTVTFEIEPLDDDQVKLTVVHDGLAPDGLMGSLISNGWPRVLSNLKTLLETGETLPHTSVRRTPASLRETRS
jgi:DNA-binding transcriptional ArsR family regulator/uncharacterized protein YndB with AHSA1/START domain